MPKNKDFSVNINQDSVVYTGISKSRDGYNSARLVAKMGDKEYMSISYEWEGAGVPDFAINLMGFMQQSKAKISEGVWEGQEAAYEEFAAKKGVFPFNKKKDEEDPEGDDKKKKDTKEEKKIDKKKK